MKITNSSKIAALLLSVVLAAGCSNTGTETTVTSDTSAITEEQSAIDTSAGEKQTGDTSLSSGGEKVETVNISDITKPFGNTGLRTYELSEGKDFSVIEIQGKLALINAYDDSVLSVDLTTGETAAKENRVISDDDWGRYSTSLVNEFPVEVDGLLGTLTVYDSSFHIISEKSISEEGNISCFFVGNSIMWCREGNILCYAEISDEGFVETGEIAAKLPEDMILSYCAGKVNENELIISYYSFSDFGSDYGILYKDTGEVVPLCISDNGYSVSAGGNIIIFEYGSTNAEIFDPDIPSVKKVIELPVGAALISPDENSSSLYFYTDLPSEKQGCRSLSIYRYDISEGRLTGKITEDIQGEYAYITNVSECGDYVVLDAYMNEYSCLLFWQPEEISEPRGYTAISGADFSEDNARLAERIKSEYSIDVFYGNNGVRYFDDYAVVTETDEKLINNALVTLDGFLGKFPEGFFEELMGKAENYNGISIYLTGRIVPNLNESQSISDAAAFVVPENDRQLMVMDITQNYGLEKNTAHEFMHIIENAMYGMSYDESGNWIDRENFSRWSMLNPEDFEYYYSYTNEDGITLNYSSSEYSGDMYYEGSGTDINSIYFVDGYSMTYPNEDRARIFENIATSAPDALPTYFKGTAMQLKSAYLCACIRESFDCIAEDTVLFWESGINPEYSLEYFRSNYDFEAYLNESAVG